MPAYIEFEDKLKEAYSESFEGFVSFLSDADGSFTVACAMEMVHPGPLGVGIIGWCKRWAFYAEKGEVKVVNVSEYEGDPAGDGYPRSSCPSP